MNNGPASEKQFTKIVSQAHRRIAWRLLPFLMLLYFVAYFDRVSLSYAGPGGMNAELALTANGFGFAAGLFFIGYTFLELPSNIALHRFGARAWLARIIVTWGIIQTAIAFVPNAETLYVLRFTLGVAEAGFVPGVLYYFTLWFNHSQRARATAWFLFASVLATTVGAPLAATLIDLGDRLDLFGMSGWRFLIFASGLPAVVLGVTAYFYLSDSPSQAKWLSAEERTAVIESIASDARAVNVPRTSVRQTLASPWVWVVGLSYMSIVYGSYALTFFLPTFIEGLQQQYGLILTPLQRSLIVAVPFAVGGASQLTIGRLGDKYGHAGYLSAMCTTIGAVGALVAAFADSPLGMLFGLCLFAIGAFGGPVLLFPLATKLYVGIGAATALAVVTMHGGVGGFVGPYVTGALIDVSGSVEIAMLVIAALLLLGGFLAITADRAVSRRVLKYRSSIPAADPTSGPIAEGADKNKVTAQDLNKVQTRGRP
ncbi:MFS transporter [Rhodococcus sp. NPDC127530]|uniref:MFS transporter n=1 Tax=unclassified Rhodococcus (in: high G+C Gram-positive bacteria) TaxID=192944 RepID=UPI00362FB396